MSGRSWPCCRSSCATSITAARAEIAYVNLAFWAGTIVAAFAFAGLARRFSLRGRLVVSAVSVGAVILV